MKSKKTSSTTVERKLAGAHKRAEGEPEITGCEICKGSLKKEYLGVGLAFSCRSCGSQFTYYYTKDGTILNYPASWGRIIGPVYVPQTVNDRWAPQCVEDEECHDPMERVVYGMFYYIFQAEDGTIRRARIGGYPDSPRKAPPGVQCHHDWSVDVLPRGSSESAE
jgi:hypothetical protein